ncbi:tripartite tricarboxylate transporter substrate binding protein [Piscinibacter sp. XHJ-5]|uniref:Bug family tripartite tricarboxylate transporter substrate binding protein n=1 Tax=Piscinibacter sp. XHJ-5 TaxID=3037797 RepID=UPI002452FC7C|nr:tripartite tricarboxylate transporter substrate binding protein [Piscinibacter sp. XHJ-5]
MPTMTLSRRAFCAAALLSLTSLATPAAAVDKPMEWVVGYAAGGGSDVVARTLAEAMSKSLNQTVIVNNKPGAGTNIAADYVAHAKDPANLMFTADFATLAANPFLYSKLSYDAEKDFAPVGLMVRFPLLLVVAPNVPAKNLQEFLAWARSQGQATPYASPGAGSPHHLATELLRERSGLKLQHVPYRGAAPALQDVMGQQVPFMFVDTASGWQHVTSGKLRAIGVASPQRVSTMSGVPTLAEQGLAGFEAYAWQGLVVRAGTPADTVALLNRSLVAALESTAVKARLSALGVEPTPGTPAQMASYARSERERWGRLIRDAGIKVD